jgi:hypothetical protein
MRNKIIEINENFVCIELLSKKYGSKMCYFDFEDYLRIKVFKWYPALDGKNFYAINTCNMFKIKMHRYLLSFPQDKIIDHINGNGLDNRKENLRIVNHRQNVYNRRSKGVLTYGAKGIVFQHGKYRVFVAGKYLGRFSDLNKAIDVSKKYEMNVYGEFSPLFKK